MISQKVAEYLDQHKIKYDVIKHPIAYTAQGIAHAAHISGKDIAKTVVLKVDGKYRMLVIPADRRVNIDAVKKIFKAKNIRIAREDEFTGFFPDCEPGGMPPLGHLYGFDAVVSEDLTKDDEIAFNGGDHNELIRVLMRDYLDLERPDIVRI